MEVELSLRVPNMKVRVLDEHGYPLDHSMVRFKKQIEVPSLPKAGTTLDLATKSGRILQAVVVRSDWHEGRGLFIVACQYASRSITPDEYGALVDDPEWAMKPLI